MIRLPEDIVKEILSYVIVCGKNGNYIFNKESYNYFKMKKFNNCCPIIALGKRICKNCCKKELKYFQMISMNCAYY